jgi:hypothetical protein
MIIDNLRSKLEWLIGYSREYEQIIHNQHAKPAEWNHIAIHVFPLKKSFYVLRRWNNYLS